MLPVVFAQHLLIELALQPRPPDLFGLKRRRPPRDCRFFPVWGEGIVGRLRIGGRHRLQLHGWLRLADDPVGNTLFEPFRIIGGRLRRGGLDLTVAEAQTPR